MVAGLEHKRLKSFDGTEIAYQVRGQGPAVVLCEGLGGSYQAFRHIYALLGEGYRTISWDYRGIYDSSAPADPRALTMEDHCRDLEVILQEEGIERAVFIGWSMGVQLSFEFFRRPRRREWIDGIVAINGTSGRPFDTVLSSRFVRYAIPVLLGAARSQAKIVGHATRTALAWEGAVPMLQRFGLVSRDLDVETFRDVAAGFGDMDMGLYMDNLRRLGEHDATDVLPEVDVPVLIITGDRDIMTPAFTAERLHRAIPGSRLVMIEGGTHYTPIEYPILLQEEIRDFLEAVPGYQSDDAA